MSSENEQKAQEQTPETPPQNDIKEKDEKLLDQNEEKKEDAQKNSHDLEKQETNQSKDKKKTCMINGFIF